MPDLTTDQLEAIRALTPVVQTIIAAFGFIVVMLQFRSSLNQRRDDQLWKQSEFAADKFEDFYQDFYVRNALQILDWRKRKIRLWKNDPSKELEVDRILLLGALEDKRQYTAGEAMIRDTFDEFFTQLGYFNNYISSRVIAEKQVKPYLAYWMDLLHVRRPRIMNAEAAECIWKYLENHNFDDALALLRRFGDGPRPSRQAVSS
jgi:hypothetical protein